MVSKSSPFLEQYFDHTLNGTYLQVAQVLVVQRRPSYNITDQSFNKLIEFANCVDMGVGQMVTLLSVEARYTVVKVYVHSLYANI